MLWYQNDQVMSKFTKVSGVSIGIDDDADGESLMHGLGVFDTHNILLILP